MKDEMAEPEESPTTQSSTRRITHRSKRQGALARFWSEWHVEILICCMVALAIFLLVERMQIRQTLLGWLRLGLRALGGMASGLLRGAASLMRNTTLSDMTGYALLLLALAFVAWRVRWRLMRAAALKTRTCPRCGGKLHRIHRRWRDRVVSLYVPVRRYRCGDPSCGWSGMRVEGSRHEA
jgi:hypothetical protein